MTEPITDRDNVIRRLGEALDLPPEVIELARTQPSIYGHWETIVEEMRKDYLTKAGMIDLSPAALFPGDDAQSREYRKLFEENEYVIDRGVSEGVRAAHERIAEHAYQAAAEQLRNGYGDLDAPLAPGEYVFSGHACPQDGCDWVLPIEWRHESSPQATRLRGLIDGDRLCRAHLAEHGTSRPSTSYLCPNTPRCAHAGALHDINDYDDPRPRCCVDGCNCGRTEPVTTETHEFHIGDILSVLTGRLVSTRHIDGVYDLLGFMVGGPLWTHQLPRAAEECKPALCEQFPNLAAIPAPDGIDSKDKLLAWLAPIEQQYGATHAVARLAAEDHTSIDPLTEMRMHYPDKPIVPIVDEGPAS